MLRRMATAHVSTVARVRVRLALLAALSPCVGAATVATFDGATVTGERLEFAAGAVIIDGRSIALGDCDWIEPAGTAKVPSPRAAKGVWLSDGGWLPATRITASGEGPRDVITVTGPLGDLTIPLSAVLGWGPGVMAPAKDSDQVVLADASTLTGRVLGIEHGTLRLESRLAPQPLELSVENITAMRLAAQAQPPRGPALSAALDGERPPLLLGAANGFPLHAAPRVTIGDALAGVRLTVEGGRRVHLGALPLAEVSEEGAFGVVWPHRVDSDLDGGPLMLGGQRHAHGLTVHSKAQLSWDLGAAYERFHALVGIADAIAPEGDCQAALEGDGKVLWSRERVSGGDKPHAVDLDIAGVRRLTLRVGYGARYDIGDHLVLADAWVLKKK
jgi:hypothetical protein